MGRKKKNGFFPEKEITEENIGEAYAEADRVAAKVRRYDVATTIGLVCGLAVYAWISLTAAFGFVFQEYDAIGSHTPLLSASWQWLDWLTGKITFGLTTPWLRWPVHWILMMLSLFLVAVVIRRIAIWVLPLKPLERAIPEDRVERAKLLATRYPEGCEIRYFNYSELSVSEIVLTIVFALIIALGMAGFLVADYAAEGAEYALVWVWVIGVVSVLFVGGGNWYLMQWPVQFVSWGREKCRGRLDWIRKKADEYWVSVDPEEDARREAARQADHEKLMRLMRHTSAYENAYAEAYRGTDSSSSPSESDWKDMAYVQEQMKAGNMSSGGEYGAQGSYSTDV